MARVINFAEVRAARSISRRCARDRKSLALAIEALKEALAETATMLRDAGPDEEAELLQRVERLAALVRYGRRMMDDGRDYAVGDSGRPDEA
jgi:hypothetical protein